MILLLAACSSPTEVTPVVPPLDSVRYAFEWAAPEQVEETPGQLTFTTDTGVTVTLTELGPIAVEEPVWCGVEALVARADANTTGVSDLTKDTSLRMVGTWTDPAGAVTPFTWTSTLHHSATGPLEWTGSGPHGEVTVVRTLDGLFDGIDFATTPPPRILRGALANLMAATRFSAARR